MVGQIGTLPNYRTSNGPNVVKGKSKTEDSMDHARKPVQQDLRKNEASGSGQAAYGVKFQNILSHLPYLGNGDINEQTSELQTVAETPLPESEIAADFVEEIASLLYTRNSAGSQNQSNTETFAGGTPENQMPDQSRSQYYRSLVDGYVQQAQSEYIGFNHQNLNPGTDLTSAMERFQTKLAGESI